MAYGSLADGSNHSDLVIGRVNVSLDLPSNWDEIEWDHRFEQFCEQVWKEDPITRDVADVSQGSCSESRQQPSQIRNEGSRDAGSAHDLSSIVNTLPEISN
jgi:hypothetical protein